MKKWIYSLALVPLVSACATLSELSPIAYHERIHSILTQTDQAYESYSFYAHQVTLQDIPQLETKRQTTIQKITKIHDALIRVGPYNGGEKPDDQYYKEAISYVTSTLGLLRTEEHKLIELWKEVAQYPDSKRTPTIENTYKDRQLVIINTINSTIEQDNHTMMIAQKEFADHHGFTLSEEKENITLD